MTLLRTLLNAGILPHDAQTLEGAFANQDEQGFLDGLEEISRIIAFNQNPTLLAPAAEPWLFIHAQLVQNGDPQAALVTAIQGYDAPVQVAITGAINVRQRELLQFAQQNQAALGKRRKTSEYEKILKNLGLRFAYNLCTQEIEVNGDAITDATAASIRGHLRDAGVWETNVAEDVYIALAARNRYHPVRDYLCSLTWQGQDGISELASHFTDEHQVFHLWLRRWLVGVVARTMAGEQNRVLVLDGPQGIGKDYFARWLCSQLPEYYYEGPIMPDDKDNRLRRLWTWIWDVNEFGSTTRRADREALKAFITTQTVKERKPYGHYDIRGPALSNFIGTVNNEIGILNDPTGNRRFMVSHILSIDWSYTHLVVDQIWAQAFALYLADEPWELTGDERRRADEINEQYLMVDIVEETIKRNFDIDPGNQAMWMSTVEILETLKDPLYGNLKAGIEVDSRRLASALTKLGLERPKNKRVGTQVIRGYYGIQRQ